MSLRVQVSKYSFRALQLSNFKQRFIGSCFELPSWNWSKGKVLNYNLVQFLPNFIENYCIPFTFLTEKIRCFLSWMEGRGGSMLPHYIFDWPQSLFLRALYDYVWSTLLLFMRKEGDLIFPYFFGKVMFFVWVPLGSQAHFCPESIVLSLIFAFEAKTCMCLYVTCVCDVGT